MVSIWNERPTCEVGRGKAVTAVPVPTGGPTLWDLREEDCRGKHTSRVQSE